MLGWGNDLVSAVGFWRFDLFGISGLLAHGFIFGRVLKFFDRLAEALSEGRQFGAAEEYEQNYENNNELGGAESEDASKGNRSSGHNGLQRRREGGAVKRESECGKECPNGLRQGGKHNFFAHGWLAGDDQDS